MVELDQIIFFKPFRTLPISVTGNKCTLNCQHCGRHYLNSMVPIEKAHLEVRRRGVTSCLISGGCDINGKVDFNWCIDNIKELKGFYKVNMHTGMVTDADLEKITELADVVSMDIPVSDDVVKKVYGLKYKPEDYLEVYKKLKNKVKTIPHLCIGLDDKGIDSEISMIKTLAGIGTEVVCFLVFIPTRNTRFEKRKPPEILDVIKVLTEARLIMPDSKIILGCMRPGGNYRKTLDSLAVLAKVDGIVMPARTAVNTAEKLGLKIVWKEECCGLL